MYYSKLKNNVKNLEIKLQDLGLFKEALFLLIYCPTISKLIDQHIVDYVNNDGNIRQYIWLIWVFYSIVFFLSQLSYKIIKISLKSCDTLVFSTRLALSTRSPLLLYRFWRFCYLEFDKEAISDGDMSENGRYLWGWFEF